MDKLWRSEEDYCEFRPTFWRLAGSIVNGLFALVFLAELAYFGAPVTPFLAFVYFAAAVWNVFLALWQYFCYLEIGDCLIIREPGNKRQAYHWSDLSRARIIHRRKFFLPNFDRLEFVTPAGEAVEYYLSDLRYSDYVLVLAVLRTKVPGILEIF